jgi:hypothetical protein
LVVPPSIDTPLQVPAALPDELHTSGGAQPLPPLPRHPSTHALFVQIRPDVAPPQSASVVHPHVEVAARHAAPAPDALQLCFSAGVHSTHWLVALHTSLTQSDAFKHATHT